MWWWPWAFVSPWVFVGGVDLDGLRGGQVLAGADQRVGGGGGGIQITVAQATGDFAQAMVGASVVVTTSPVQAAGQAGPPAAAPAAVPAASAGPVRHAHWRSSRP